MTDRISRSEICRSILTNWFVALLLLSGFSLMSGIGERTENGKSHFSRLARFDRKISFHFSTIVQTGQSDKSTPCVLRNQQFYIAREDYLNCFWTFFWSAILCT